MKKDTYSVEVLGFNPTEIMALTSVFDLSSRRVPKFVRHSLPGSAPDLFLVDADDLESVHSLSLKNVSANIPTIMVGASNRGTPWMLMPRPIRWMKLFQAFEESVRQMELRGVKSSPKPDFSSETHRFQPVPGDVETSGIKMEKIDHVLVVDDNMTVREFMKNKLSAFNFKVDYAESGEEAIGFTGKKHYSCIFLDVVMPGIDGYQVCKLIKANRTPQKTTVIMLTSKDSPFDKIRGSMSGCDAYLTKPVDEEKLFSAITKFLPK